MPEVLRDHLELRYIIHALQWRIYYLIHNLLIQGDTGPIGPTGAPGQAGAAVSTYLSYITSVLKLLLCFSLFLLPGR